MSKVNNKDGYNQAIATCQFFLHLFGAWPDSDDKNNWMSNVRILIVTMTMFLFATVSQTIKMFRSWGDLNVAMEILSNCNLPTSIATVKIASIWYHRDVLRELIHQIKEDWKIPHVDYELKIMWRNAKISRYFSIGCIFMTEGTLMAQCVVGILNIIDTIKSDVNNSMEWPLYMLGSFPYNVQTTPNYILTNLAQVLSNVFASISFSTCDSFFIVLMFHLIGQLSILKLTLYNLPKQIKSSNDRNEFMDRFAVIVMRHNELRRFSTNIEESFNLMFLIQMTPCIFALCAQGYQLITITGAENISFMELVFMMYFLLLFLFTIFTYCYVGEILRQESMEISKAAYNCNWTILPAKEASLLILIILRAQDPFEITAGKFANFSLQFYCRILKTSAGYLSMLLAVKDRMV